MYTVLLLGSGGREHAIAWTLARSPRLKHLYCAPGNPGIAHEAELRSIDINDPAAVVDLARELGADLVVVGPENPLAAGVADALGHAGIPVFGPSRAAARLEWDKGFAKEFMVRHGIPTAASRTFTDEQQDEAREFVRRHDLPVVLKAGGLAAGKGVVIADATDQALDALDGMLSGASFGDAGRSVVVEDFLEGEEASVFAICDGQHYVLLAPSQDHKAIGDGDVGPNTGGMGAYAPAPVVTDEVLARVRSEIVEPTLEGMRGEGAPFVGCLFVGLMIDGGVARVVEFNSRFGDPEAQVVLPLLDADLLELMYAAATGRLADSGAITATGCAVCVVMASEGYPGHYQKGHPITGIERAEARKGIIVFHAGTTGDDSVLRTAGGRVLGVTAVTRDGSLQHTIDLAYAAVAEISWPGAYHRTDIGRKGVATA